MYESLLKKIGLTENEARTYLALSKIGSATTSKIVSAANISGGKVYETLDKLYKKGLVSINTINGVKHFQTTKPEAILDFLEEKKNNIQEQEAQFKKILPQLSSIGQEQTFFSETLIGTRSVKPLIEELFANAKEPIMAMGIRGDKKTKYNSFWWHITTEQLENKNKKAKYLFIEDHSEYYKKHMQLKNIEIRSLKTVSPAAIDIIDNHVIILTYDEDVLHCVHIHNKPIAESFKAFFNNLWEKGKCPHRKAPVFN